MTAAIKFKQACQAAERDLSVVVLEKAAEAGTQKSGYTFWWRAPLGTLAPSVAGYRPSD